MQYLGTCATQNDDDDDDDNIIIVIIIMNEIKELQEQPS